MVHGCRQFSVIVKIRRLGIYGATKKTKIGRYKNSKRMKKLMNEQMNEQ